MSAQKYRKLPVEIEAWAIASTRTAESNKAFFEWCPQARFNIKGELVIETLEGDMLVSMTDFIIKGVNGEFYPCKFDIFWKTYEEVQ